jgi:glycosyltransferase involved in cell wall biosynthesis
VSGAAEPAEDGRALAVRGPYRGASGHDHHVREFVRHLARHGIRLQLVDIPEWGPVKLEPGQRDPWFDSLGEPVGAGAVIHFCMPPQVTPTPGLLHVNYTMFEATRIPGRWVDENRRHHLVVLPSASSREAWVASGFPAERIRLCPLGVDPSRFHPDTVPLDLGDRRGRPVRDYRVRVLNVSEAGPRKNLVGLLRAWIRATARQDDAILVMKLGRGIPGWTLRLFHDLALAERSLGKTRHAAAPVLFDDRVLGDADMPRLFALATHYWSMSHGEGWDQPMVEAGATGLGLIAPDHSAYASYLDDSVATMIPARRVPAMVPGDAALSRLFAGSEWWEPDEDAAVAAIQGALRSRSEPGPNARPRIAAELTWDRATDRLLEIVEELHAGHGRAF